MKQMIVGDGNVVVGGVAPFMPQGDGLKKPWYLSKVLWFNAACAALATAEATAHMIQPYVDGNVYAWGMVALTIGNAGLRVVTKAQLSMGMGRVDEA